jgi:ribosomal protein S3
VKRPVYSGLFVGPLDTSAFTTTVQTALSAGAAGVSIFDAGAMNAERWALLAKVTSGVV